MPDNKKIPQILRDIPPEKFRALIEALLGGPLQHQTSGSRREVVENPTEDQLRLPHAELMGNKIMLFHRREKLVFETDWLPSDSVSDFARSIAQTTYLGAMSSSRFLLKDGTEVACADRWAEMLEPGPVEPASPWPEKSRTAHEVNIGSICKGIVERVEREADEAETPCPECGEPCSDDEVRCPHCGFGADPETD